MLTESLFYERRQQIVFNEISQRLRMLPVKMKVQSL